MNSSQVVKDRRRPNLIPYEPTRQQLRMNSTRSQRLTKTQPDPVRAYEAVTTDELSIRGQRPTKAHQPNPVRAYKAVTTDEFSTYGRRPTIPYEPRGSIDGRTFHTRSEIFCIFNLPSAAMVANFFIHPRPLRRVSLCGVYADSSQ